MNCRDVQRYVHAFIDGELEPQQALDLEGHLERCEACSKAAEFERWFKSELRRSVGAVFPPAELQDRIRGALDRAERQDRVRQLVPRIGAFGAMAAAIVAALFVPSWLTPTAEEVARPAMGRPVFDYVAERHARSLPLEVTGPDATNVSQWFQDKVDFAVNPPAFGSRPVQLVGGRISHVGDRQAAHLLYEGGGHRITVVVFDGSGLVLSGAPSQRAGGRTFYYGESRGYPVAVWQQGGVAYAVSSDLSQPDFHRLVTSVQ